VYICLLGLADQLVSRNFIARTSSAFLPCFLFSGSFKVQPDLQLALRKCVFAANKLQNGPTERKREGEAKPSRLNGKWKHFVARCCRFHNAALMSVCPFCPSSRLEVLFLCLSVLISGRLIATATLTETRVSFFTLIHLANITQCRATDEPRLAAFDPVSVLCVFVSCTR